MSTPSPRKASPPLELLDVSKSFGRTQALAGASLTVRRGEIHALLGENGAGKSTLVSIAAGVLRADGGRIRLGGREVRFPSPRDARRAGIALVPQHDLLVEASTVAANLALLDPGTPFFESPGARKARVRRLAERFALDLGAPDALVAELPVGSRQRIEIAGALAGDPEILILDEPTIGLDPAQIKEIRELIKSLRGEHTIMLSTHILAEVTQTCDGVVIINEGRLMASGSLEELTASFRKHEGVILKLRQGHEEASSTFKGVPGVERVSRQDGEFTIEWSQSRDLREAISQIAVEKGWGLLEMRPVAMNIEDLYLQIIGGGVGQ
jgi:ABC-2 type transport system ATP-binding protein